MQGIEAPEGVDPTEEEIREGLVYYNVLVGVKVATRNDGKAISPIIRYGMGRDEAEMVATRVSIALKGEGLGSEYEVKAMEGN